MHQSVQRFYYRRALTFREILLSASLDRNPMILLENSINSRNYDLCMEEIALGTWIFPTLPGNNPATGWPESLDKFYSRLKSLRPLSLWAEPFDENYQFQQNAYDFITNLLVSSKDKYEQNRENLKLALLSVFGITLNSGSFDRMLNFISFLLKNNSPNINQLILDTSPEIISMLNSYSKYRENWQFLHCIRPDSAQGTFKIARPINFSGQKSQNCSVATDGSYLYVFFIVQINKK